MAYIGKEPTTGNFIYADDITTSSTNTYNILVGGVAFSPESANHLIVSLNGVIQKANTSFSVSGSQITFLPSSGTLSSSDSIDFILILGTVNAVGVATTVSDSAITKGKLNLISDSSSAGLTVKGDGSSKNGQIQLNCHQNSHGIKLSSPDHSAGQSYELIFPTGNVTADKVLKVASVSGSGTTGIGQLSFADAGGTNTPAFRAYLSSNQTINDATDTVVSLDSEDYDTDSAFDTSNYRFTVPSGEAGKYFFYAQAYFAGLTSPAQLRLRIRKNTSTIIAENYIYSGGTGTAIFTEANDNLHFTVITSTTADLSVSDKIDISVVQDPTNTDSGTVEGNTKGTFLHGYKLIGV
jgi:hypothetical protein